MRRPVERKVKGAGVGGSLSILVVWLLSQAGVDLPPEVASAVSTIVATVSGYLIPESG